eukprot:1955496-Rhodomonas_salina.1
MESSKGAEGPLSHPPAHTASALSACALGVCWLSYSHSVWCQRLLGVLEVCWPRTVLASRMALSYCLNQTRVPAVSTKKLRGRYPASAPRVLDQIQAAVLYQIPDVSTGDFVSVPGGS